MQITVEKLSKEKLHEKGVEEWPVWEKEISRFDWTYENQEQCYFLEGHVRIKTQSGEVEIQKGDFVTFPKGLSCVWDIRAAVRKHYNFGS